MFKIGFDAKRLFNNYTGLGNYSRTLVHGLQKYYPENNYYLFSPTSTKNSDTSKFFDNPYKIIQPSHALKNIWRSFTSVNDIKKHQLNLFHGLSHELPFGIKKTGTKSLVTIHDLIYKTYPHDFKYIDRNIYDYKFRYACEHANKVIAVSQSTKNDLQTFYNIPEDKIEVVYQSCMEQFKVECTAKQKQELQQKFNLPKQFMLSVGSIIERKNLLGIVKAINKIKDQVKMPLVVVGHGKAYKIKVLEYIRENKLEKHVIFVNGISFQELPNLYQMADLFLYPSFYEGFGIPIIEALWSKTPVITTNISSLPEAAGPGAFFCKPGNINTIAEGIVKINSDPSYKQQLIEEGYNYVKRFENDKNAEKLMQVYKNVLKA